MFKLLKTVFKAGDVTTKYPFKPYEVDDDFRGKPELNSDQCIVCAVCTIACPANALTMRTDPVTGERTWSLFLGRCIFCGRCEEVCPTKAIRLSQDFELSVTNKQDLFQETTFSTVSCQECGKPFISYKELNYTIDLFKQSLGDPEVGDVHGHAVIEAVAAVLESGCETRHTAHLFGDRHRVRVDLVNEPVGKREVDDRVAILMAVVIVAVVTEGFAEAVAIVKHGGDAVEAEAIEAVLVEPEFAVGEQEVEHLVTPIIEAKRIPGLVFTPTPGVKVLVIRSVEATEAFGFVLDRVAMHDVHDHSQAERMGVVDEVLQLFRGAEARGSGEETADMIAERAVIRVLLNGHDLDGVVSIVSHARQDVDPEFLERPRLLFLRSHAYMALIDEQWRCVRPKIIDAKLVLLRRVPNLGRKDLRHLILHHTSAPGGDAFTGASLPLHEELVQVAVVERVCGQCDLPIPSRTLEAMKAIILALLPAVKIADEVYRGRIGRPFPERPASVCRAVKAEIEVSGCEVREAQPAVLR